MIEVGEAGEGLGEKDLAPDHPYLDGDGFLPEPLLVEALAQTIALAHCSAVRAPAGGGEETGLLAGLREFDFHLRARAPVRLFLRVRMERAFGGLTTYEARATNRDGALLAAGKITVASLPGGATDAVHSPPSARDPFDPPERGGLALFDRLEVAPNGGKAARAEKLVTGRESYLAGHFPGQPIVPGAVLFESLNRLCLEVLGPRAALRRAERVRFRRIVRPSDALVFDTGEAREEGGIVRFTAQALAGADLVADAVLGYESAKGSP